MFCVLDQQAVICTMAGVELHVFVSNLPHWHPHGLGNWLQLLVGKRRWVEKLTPVMEGRNIFGYPEVFDTPTSPSSLADQEV